SGGDYLRGTQQVVVVPGLDSAQLNLEGSANLRFNVDASGAVTSQNAAAAAGVGATLFLHNSTITIDPGAYDSDWWLGGGDYHRGTRQIVVVPGLPSAQ